MQSIITLGVTTDPFREDIVDRYERGFRTVELRLSEPLLIGHSIELIKELERLVDEYDINISSIHVPEIRPNGIPVDFAALDEQTRNISMELVNRTIEMAYGVPTRRVILTLPPFLNSRIFETERIKESVNRANYRCIEQLRTYIEKTESGGISLCLKNPPPIISKTTDGNYFAISGGTPEAVYNIIRKLDEYRVWIALDFANMHLFSNAMIKAYWPENETKIDPKVAWIRYFNFNPMKSIVDSIKRFSDHIEVIYLSNARGIIERGLPPVEGEIGFQTLLRDLKDFIFPERPIIIDVEEREREKAINAELALAFIYNQLRQR